MQASGVSQIDKAMATVASVTQRNASAAEELASRAASLQDLLGYFRTREEGIAPPRRAEEPSRRPWGAPALAPRIGGESGGGARRFGA